MLKVSLLMLLAMALAATSAHARLDLFGQVLTSMNQPNPNSERVLQVLVKGKGKSNVDDEPLGAIPYTECINTCENCWCTLKWPPESNICICGDKIKPKNLAAAVQEVESSSSKVKSDCGKNTASNSKKPAIQNLGDDKKVVLWTKAKSDQIPYYECIETCEICICDRRVPELAMCTCGDPKVAGRALPI
ncbi:hypothetical protein M0R45_020268 [Rubus argutus]|uniref:Uncharacterized protein n=1 Tax=Rubus argutus TaxID=59490 RepID=A0AAW1X9I4_RUBAR